jgi:hypothetical protein
MGIVRQNWTDVLVHAAMRAQDRRKLHEKLRFG